MNRVLLTMTACIDTTTYVVDAFSRCCLRYLTLYHTVQLTPFLDSALNCTNYVRRPR